MLHEGKKMDMPTMPPTPRPALVLNLSLPMVKGGNIIPQPLWMESQLRDYAQQHAQQFERAAANLAIDCADLRAALAAVIKTDAGKQALARMREGAEAAAPDDAALMHAAGLLGA